MINIYMYFKLAAESGSERHMKIHHNLMKYEIIEIGGLLFMDHRVLTFSQQ